MTRKATSFLALMMLALPVSAEWDESVLVGQWESYKHEHMRRYQRLEINKDFSGTFTYLLGDQPPASASFSKDNFSFFEGFAVLAVDQGLRFVLSAWSLPGVASGKMLVGQSFIYTSQGEELSLINAEPVRFLPAEDGGIKGFLQNAQQLNEETSP